MPSSSKVIKQFQIGPPEDMDCGAPMIPVPPDEAFCQPGGGRGSVSVTSHPGEDTRREEILEAARQEAEAILAAARQEAKAVVEAARQEAEQMQQVSYRMGYARGSQEGLAQEKKRFEFFLEDVDRQVAEQLAELQNLMDRIRDEYEEELLKLALLTAGRFVDTHFSQEDLLDRLAEMLDDLIREETIYVRMHPENHQLLSGAENRFREICPDSRFTFMRDARLGPFEVVLETQDRYLEFSPRREIETLVHQLIEIRRKRLHDPLQGTE